MLNPVISGYRDKFRDGDEFDRFLKSPRGKALARIDRQGIMSGEITGVPKRYRNDIGFLYVVTSVILYELKDEHDDLLKRGFGITDRRHDRNVWYNRLNNFLVFLLGLNTDIVVYTTHTMLALHKWDLDSKRLPHFSALTRVVEPSIR